MARLLVIADSAVPTGFGTVTDNIGRRLVEDFGHELHVLAINWRGDYTADLPFRMYLPTQLQQQDLYGQSRYVELVGQILPDAILFVNDPAVVLNSLLDNKFDEQRVLWRGYQVKDNLYKPPILAYMPIDGYDSPRSWDILKERVTRIAMTKFGRDTAMPEAPVIWHGVNGEVFKPLDKREAKKIVGYDPDRFLVLRVDKNSTRKDYPATWKAMKPLMRKYGDIDLHFHCLPRSGDGYDLRALMFNDEDVRDRVNFSANLHGFGGWPDTALATLMSAADLVVSTSWAEGFGLTLLEAMSCGTPVVAQNCSAITEVVGPGGVLVEPAGRISTPMGQDQCLPDIPAFTAAIERLYLGRGSRRKLGEAAIKQAGRFSWDVAAARMASAIEKSLTT